MLLTTPRNNYIEVACRTVASHYFGELGLWTYAAFDWVNQTLFAGELPYPLIVIGLAAHSACLGWTCSTDGHPPTIMLHPFAVGRDRKKSPLVDYA